MCEKVKKVFTVIGTVFTVIVSSLLLLFRRRNTDGQGSTGTDERDTAIKTGLEQCEERADRIEEGSSKLEEGITRAEERTEQCSDHLQRAEDILRTAIERSRQEQPEA